MKSFRSSLLRAFNILLIAGIAAIFSPPVSAQSPLTDDAHTSTAPKSADSNFGNNPNLTVSSSGNVYIKFNLAATLPAGTSGTQVERATLKLFTGNITLPGKVDVYEVLSAWQESTITYNNAPILGSLVATTQQITTDQRGKFLIIDITATVRQWLGNDGQGAGGMPNHGIALLAHPVDATTPELIGITFDSKENSQTSHEPKLSIYLKGDAAGGGLESVARDATLVGDGTAGSPLGVAGGAIGAAQIANGAVTETMLGDGAVTGVKLADGSVTSVKIATPLSLAGAGPAGTLSVTNTGGGAAITATGAVNVTGSLTANGSVSFLGLRTETAAATPNVIGGNSGNFVTAGVIGATIGGGGGTGPFFNRVTDDFGTIGGGFNNQAGDNAGTTTNRDNATVGGGLQNTASGAISTIGGGSFNFASGAISAVGGGSGNIASGVFSTVPGGGFNRAAGDFSFAAGFRAKADHNGAFVWADSTNADFASTADNQFLIRAAGGVGIGTTAPADQLHVAGDIRVGTGATGCVKDADGDVIAGTCSSDLRFKKQIKPFASVIERLSRLQPVHFHWRADEYPARRFGTSQSYGLIAQEVEEVLPELVSEDEQGYKAVNYSKLPLLMLQAIKELKAENEALKQRLQRQDERLRRIEARSARPARNRLR